MSEVELIHSLNYKSEKLFNVIDTYDNHVYPIKEKIPSKYNEIMTQVYKNTHKSTLSGERLNEWMDNFPNMVDRKIDAEKRKLKVKRKDLKKSKKAKERHKTSHFRNQNIMSQLESIGYYSINQDSKMAKMREGLENDEIIQDLVSEISDPYGSDHDMVEINYDDQFKRQIQEYEDRYKYVYVIEDVEPTVKSKEVVKRVPSKKRPPLKQKKNLKKSTIKKVKEKLISTIVLSKNPITITPVEELEHIKKKPSIKKKRAVKKKPDVKKKPIVKKKLVKKKKSPIKKKSVAKKKPIVKKKLVKKKKHLPKVKSIRAKRRNSPIMGRWTARYRKIGGKKRKVLIRKWKGKIQTRVIN
ncbi:hypothetical protein LCGC14_1994830 [marine sediment metagenome]|uniref:Uncharacterized protein n=1 Tax=marine sediment metagenome TaxID=412755 RepID=A0A0F9FT06_9ZZZZ